MDAEIPALPGEMVSGAPRNEAESKVQALALHVIADRLERDNETIQHLQFEAAPGRQEVRIRQLVRPDYTWAFHDGVEIGPKALARIAKQTGLRPEDL